MEVSGPGGREFSVVVCSLEGERCSLDSEGVVGQLLNCAAHERIARNASQHPHVQGHLSPA